MSAKASESGVTKGKRRKRAFTVGSDPYQCEVPHEDLAWNQEFWQHTMNVAEDEDDDFKQQTLPLARIKKVMKSDPDITQMVSGETTILFEKACQMFIQELTVRAQAAALSSNRRTVQGGDVVTAATGCNMYDFLIDVLPRRSVQQAEASSSRNVNTRTSVSGSTRRPSSRRTATDDKTLSTDEQDQLGEESEELDDDDDDEDDDDDDDQDQDDDYR